MRTSTINKALKYAVNHGAIIIASVELDSVLAYLDRTYGISNSRIVLNSGSVLRLTRGASGAIKLVLVVIPTHDERFNAVLNELESSSREYIMVQKRSDFFIIVTSKGVVLMYVKGNGLGPKK